MLWKIFLVGALAIGVMAAIKDGRLLKDAGLLSRCNAASVNGRPEPRVLNCSKGRLDGFPDMTKQDCTLISVSQGHEFWRCPVPVVSSESPNGG